MKFWNLGMIALSVLSVMAAATGCDARRVDDGKTNVDVRIGGGQGIEVDVDGPEGKRVDVDVGGGDGVKVNTD
jgi:hypothetical protein